MPMYVHNTYICTYVGRLKEEDFQFVLESWLESSAVTHPLLVTRGLTSIPTSHAIRTHNTHTHNTHTSLQYSATATAWNCAMPRRLDVVWGAHAQQLMRMLADLDPQSERALSRGRAKAVERDAHAASSGWLAKLVAKCSKSRRRRSQVEVCPQTASVAPSNSHTQIQARTCMYSCIFVCVWRYVCVACKFSPLAAHGDDCTLP